MQIERFILKRIFKYKYFNKYFKIDKFGSA